MGFEPTEPCHWPGGFQDRSFQPLSQPSDRFSHWPCITRLRHFDAGRSMPQRETVFGITVCRPHGWAACPQADDDLRSDAETMNSVNHEEAFRTNTSLGSFSARAAEIVEEVKRLRTIRHDIIHGIVLDKLDTGARRFHRFTFTKNVGEAQISDYTFEQILTHFREMLTLRGRTFEFTRDFLGSINANDLQNVDS